MSRWLASPLSGGASDAQDDAAAVAPPTCACDWRYGRWVVEMVEVKE